VTEAFKNPKKVPRQPAGLFFSAPTSPAPQLGKPARHPN
jgi:hypothetical protein